MIWIIVSLPFWAIAAACSFVGAGCTAVGLSRYIFEKGREAGHLDQDQQSYFLVGMFFFASAGMSAFIAAKIVS